MMMNSHADFVWLASPSEERRVLIVDDEPLVLNSLRKVVERGIAPSAVLVAAGGDEAIETLRRGPVDLVVTDLSMPGVDGYGLLRGLRDMQFQGHTAVMSGHITPEIELRLRNLGALACLQKPLQASQFLQLCQHAFEGHDSLRGLSPVSVAQMLELEGKSCLLRIHYDSQRGDLAFSDGKLVDAWTSQDGGECAAETILAWPAGEMQLHYLPPRGLPRIRRALGQIILEAAHREDEARRGIDDETDSPWSDTGNANRVTPSPPEPPTRFCEEELDLAFADLLGVGGARYVALIDARTGRIVRESSAGPEGESGDAATLGTRWRDVFGGENPADNALVTWSDQHHMMRTLQSCERFLLYWVIGRPHANLALASHRLQKHSSRVRPIML